MAEMSNYGGLQVEVLHNCLAPFAPLVGLGNPPAVGDHPVGVLQARLLSGLFDEVLGQFHTSRKKGSIK